MNDPWGVVLGASLALVGTVLVQAWLVPRTQRRIRQRERWEKDVRELADLLAKPVLIAVRDLHVAMRHHAIMRIALKAGDSDAGKAHMQTRVDVAADKQEAIETQAVQNTALVRTLVLRLQYLNPDAEAWKQLRKIHGRFVMSWARLYMTDKPLKMPTTDTVDDVAKNHEEAIEELAAWVEVLAKVNEPPKRPAAHRRVQQRVRRLGSASRSSS
ncbi:hypothetical protein [Catellatospora vulcania]|uniref:hypothetical protein n=1 Tax=Catellatospora vulcania TaxID=1460450 RepID=UPI0012D443E8|nr:hypothetical protein [Catellatospora vulcania]